MALSKYASYNTIPKPYSSASTPSTLTYRDKLTGQTLLGRDFINRQYDTRPTLPQAPAGYSFALKSATPPYAVNRDGSIYHRDGMANACGGFIPPASSHSAQYNYGFVPNPGTVPGYDPYTHLRLPQGSGIAQDYHHIPQGTGYTSF